MSLSPRLWTPLARARTLVTAIKGGRPRRRSARRQWAAPRGPLTHGSLAARCLGSSGPPVVLLHGMAGSHVYWGADFDVVSDRARLVALDLLGFGESPKPHFGYGPREHADAVAACLLELGIDEPAVLVGHSMGTLVALALATHHPDVVDRVVAIAAPIYLSRADGVRHVRAMGRLQGLMAFGSTSRRMCRWMCKHRALASHLVTFLQPGLPVPIARAGVQHTWASYSQSMEGLILSGESPGWLATITRPVQLIVAQDDPVPDPVLLSRLCEVNDLVSLDIWPDGGHHLPLTRPAECLAAIAVAIDLAGSPGPSLGRGALPAGELR